MGSWALDAPLAGEPAPAGDGCFVMDRAGGIMAVGRDGKRLWSINLKAATVGVASGPGSHGLVLDERRQPSRSRRSDGAELDRISLGILPDGGLLQAGQAGPGLRGKGNDSSRDGRASHRRPTLNRVIERQVP